MNTMDARLDSPVLGSQASSRSLIDHAELRSLLSNLSHELCRPLISLRAGFDLLLSDAARPISRDQRGHVQTMVVLCDDLLRLTRSYLDYAGLIQGTRPLCYGAFTLGALVREIVDQMRGEIAITSVVGQGTRVTVELPSEPPSASARVRTPHQAL